MQSVGWLCMQLSYSWLNRFLETNQQSATIYSLKLKGLFYERVDKDKMNGIGKLYMQLRYPWLNSFVSKSK